MNKDGRSPFAWRWELKEATSSRWSCAGDSVSPPLAPGWVWPVRLSSLTSWPDCSTACRLPICPPSQASRLYLPLLRSRPATFRRCAPCASIQSLHSTPNDFLKPLETCFRKWPSNELVRDADKFIPHRLRKGCLQDTLLFTDAPSPLSA